MEYSVFRKLSGTFDGEKVILQFYRSQRAKESSKPLVIKIYRQECLDFLFGRDYEEFIYSLEFKDATKVYEGVLQKNCDINFYTYEDKDVIKGTTYAYYIGSTLNETVYGPLLIKPRNQQLWLPFEEMTNDIKQLKASYPELVNIKNHGHSVLGREINSITIGNLNHIKLGFVGLIHAGESGPELMLYIIKKLLKEQHTLLKKIGLSFLINANPDQREKQVLGTPWYLRKNANGVDLNRNFNAQFDIVEFGYGYRTDVKTSPTYRGDKPESEPETKALVDFIEYTMPKVVFSFHSLSSICTDSFLLSKYSKDDTLYISKCMKYLEPYTKGFGVKKKPSIYFGTSYGSLPHYLYTKYGIPAFDMELGEVDDKTKHMVIHDQVTSQLMEYYQKKHYQGIREVIKSCIS
ncbi:MAG: hypothetical protein KAG94_01200 [Clostridiales bacterium]|nr:hypothetical protein [Clostridiales bacterium]